MVATTLTAVIVSVGEVSGCVIASAVFLTAVHPKLAPSPHASRWTRNHAPDSPVCWPSQIWNTMKPIGASNTDDNARQSRSSPDREEGRDDAT